MGLPARGWHSPRRPALCSRPVPAPRLGLWAPSGTDPGKPRNRRTGEPSAETASAMRGWSEGTRSKSHARNRRWERGQRRHPRKTRLSARITRCDPRVCSLRAWSRPSPDARLRAPLPSVFRRLGSHPHHTDAGNTSPTRPLRACIPASSGSLSRHPAVFGPQLPAESPYKPGSGRGKVGGQQRLATLSDSGLRPRPL